MNQANQNASFGKLFPTRAAPTSPARGDLLRQLAAALDGIRRRRQLARDRRALQQLDDRLLRDIGLTRADLETELRKPMWRADSQDLGRGGFGNN